MKGKVIIFSAPSGSGKSTIINRLLGEYTQFEFSISATSRLPRGAEQNGKEYYFFTPDEFRERIAKNAFIEWEEVYSGCHYGTLREEIQRIWNKGNIVVFDVDVKGGINLKKMFGDAALSLFIMPPSIEALKSRLINRGTDSIEKITQRLAKAEYEMSFAKAFDYIVVNDSLEKAVHDVERLIDNFIRE